MRRRLGDLGLLLAWVLLEGCGGSSQPPTTVVQAAASCLPCLGRCAADLIALKAAHDQGPAVVDGGAR